MTDGPAADLELAVVTCTVDVGLPVEECWRSVRNFADAGRFLDVPSLLISGDGGIGSVRRIGDAILEAMIGQSDTSYTYVQAEGPMAAFQYHGCVAVTSTGLTSSTLTYTITYNQALIETTKREAERLRITARFQGAVEAMKRAAERGQAAVGQKLGG